MSLNLLSLYETFRWIGSPHDYDYLEVLPFAQINVTYLGPLMFFTHLGHFYTYLGFFQLTPPTQLSITQLDLIFYWNPSMIVTHKGLNDYISIFEKMVPVTVFWEWLIEFKDWSCQKAAPPIRQQDSKSSFPHNFVIILMISYYISYIISVLPDNDLMCVRQFPFLSISGG